MLCKHEGMEGEIGERVVKGRSVVGSLTGVMNGRTVSMDVKRGLRNSILLPSLTYGLENWTWNEAQRSRVRAVEMSYLRGACRMNRWDGLSIECVQEMWHERAWKWGRVWCGGMRGKEHPEMVWPY